MTNGPKGSLANIQTLANTDRGRSLFNLALQETDGIKHSAKWFSPLKNDPSRPYKEYRDGPFVDVLVKAGLKTNLSCTAIKKSLSSFWPTRGQHWDGIAYDSETDEVLIIEAKSHCNEMRSSCMATSPISVKRIKTQLRHVANVFNVQPRLYDERIWFGKYYQTANRLAMLWFLTNVIGAPNVRLINLFFFNDPSVLRESKERFIEMEKHVRDSLSLPRGFPLKSKVSDVYVDFERLN